MGNDKPPISLHKAASSGDLEAIKAQLDNGASLGVLDSLGSSPLHLAASNGHWAVTRLLLEKGMSPQARDGDDNIPLHLAAKSGHLEVVKLLLECDKSTARAWNKWGETVLHFAAGMGDEAMTELVLRMNPLTTASAHGETALHRAAENGHARICEMLMQYDQAHKPGWNLRMIGIKEQVAMKDFCKHTPFVYAVKEGHVNVVELFLRGKWVSPKARNGYKEILFHEAVKAGKCDIVQLFLDYGAPINLKGGNGKTALHLAADTRNLEMARMLLESGASTKIKDSIMFTPAECSHDPQVTMLIREYADRATSRKGKAKVAPPKAAVPAPPEYVA